MCGCAFKKPLTGPYITEVMEPRKSTSSVSTAEPTLPAAAVVESLLPLFVMANSSSELIIPSGSPSNMTDYLSSLLIWTADNDMQLNTFKTKEMILGRIDLTSIPSLSTPTGPIQCVTTFKLLGLHLDASLSWTTHINTIVSKASKRLYFLIQLRRAGVPPQQLLHFYMTVIRPVLEYASPVWHYSITRAQSQHLESIQTRAVHIIFSFTRGMSYPNVLFVAN